MDAALDLGINVVIFASLCLALWIAAAGEDEEKRRERSREAGAWRPTPLLQVCQGRLLGTVRRFSEKNGIGFIACASCREVHGRDVQLFREDWEALDLKVGDAVSFQLSFDERFPCAQGRPWAKDVKKE